MKKLLFLLLILTSCSPVREALKYEHRSKELSYLIDSYYITIENPENNLPNEQDSIIKLIKQEVKWLKQHH